MLYSKFFIKHLSELTNVDCDSMSVKSQTGQLVD